MNARRLVVLLAAAAFVAVAAAIEPPPPEPVPQSQAEPAAPDVGTDADGEETLPPLPPDSVPAEPPPQRFDPTEKVRADFPVSFPIDI